MLAYANVSYEDKVESSECETLQKNTCDVCMSSWGMSHLSLSFMYTHILSCLFVYEQFYDSHALSDGSWDRSEWTDEKFNLSLDFPNLVTSLLSLSHTLYAHSLLTSPPTRMHSRMAALSL